MDKRDIKYLKQTNDLNYFRQQQQFALERKFATEDWEKQNQYNSPEQQMNRLRQAGLNPNLVYGKGADNTAMAISRTTSTPPQAIAPKRDMSGRLMNVASAANDFGQTLGNYYQTQNIQAQTDNLYAQNALLAKEGYLKDAELVDKTYSGKHKEFDLNLKQSLKDNIIEKSRLDNVKTRADTQYTLDENERKKLSSSLDLKKTLSEIALNKVHELKTQLESSRIPLEKSKIQQEIEASKAIIEVTRSDALMKQLQLQMAQNGVMPNDPWYYRTLAEISLNITGNHPDRKKSENRGHGGPTR